MKYLYSRPWLVYGVCAVLAAIGLGCAWTLPMDLFPHSSQPKIGVHIDYRRLDAESFHRTYGGELERALHGIYTKDLKAQEVTAQYDDASAHYKVTFRGGDDGSLALAEVSQVLGRVSAGWPEDLRRFNNVWKDNRGAAFFFAQIYSTTLSNEELYKLLITHLSPGLAAIEGHDILELYNPDRTEIMIELDPYDLAQLKISPKEIMDRIRQASEAYGGGVIQAGEQKLSVHIPRALASLEDLRHVEIPLPQDHSHGTAKTIYLEHIAKITETSGGTQGNVQKVNGHKTVGLYVTARSGTNVKHMTEQIVQLLDSTLPTLPSTLPSTDSHVAYMALVNPGTFIEQAISHVGKEVLLSALLAVLVLFLFVGNLRNTFTATLEIPLSIFLAFILMKLTGVELNLISLGGLALSTGMNVDASIVVLENLLRRFELAQGASPGKSMSLEEKLQVTVAAVKEITPAVLTSTAASLVVFLPLVFTSGLTYAVLGDLAKAVVFSHGLSALVALVLVPTIRLHLLGSASVGSSLSQEEREKKLAPRFSVFYALNQGLQHAYERLLGGFLRRPKWMYGSFLGVALCLGVCLWWIPPRLPKELIGTPDTDIIWTRIHKASHTHMSEIEALAQDFEEGAKAAFPGEILYSYAQLWSPQSGGIALTLKDKSAMARIQKALEKQFPNTVDTFYTIRTFNPADMPLPKARDMRVRIRSEDPKAGFHMAAKLYQSLVEAHLYRDLESNPGLSPAPTILLTPDRGLWPGLQYHGLGVGDLAQFVRLCSHPTEVAQLKKGQDVQKVMMRFPGNFLNSPADLEAFPVGIKNKLIPLGALAQVSTEKTLPLMYYENLLPVISIEGVKPEAPFTKQTALQEVQKLMDAVVRSEEGLAQRGRGTEGLAEGRTEGQTDGQTKRPSVHMSLEDPDDELSQASRELALAMAIALLLIFAALLCQFGHIVHCLIIMLAIPFGLIGVLISLWVFHSTLSLNSLLGVMLLNGLAVANSIMLVDVLREELKKGLSPLEAALAAGRARIRPICMTSLTTILGMLPIALGLGDGGKILQPLGIAICGGLWVSLLFTLFLVPGIEVAYLNFVGGTRPPVGEARPSKTH